MTPDQTYELLRNLTSPVVAVTSRRGDTRNGMISDGAVRASIVPDIPRLAVFIHKINYSHDLIFATGRFGLHILHDAQFPLIHTLGFQSGRDRDKLADVPHRLGTLGVPVLDDHFAAFECEVINAMDTGSSTCFLGEARAVHQGPGTRPMTPAYLRAHLPPEWVAEYMAKLGEAQAWARQRSHQISREAWTPPPA